MRSCQVVVVKETKALSSAQRVKFMRNWNYLDGRLSALSKIYPSVISLKTSNRSLWLWSAKTGNNLTHTLWNEGIVAYKLMPIEEFLKF